MSLQVWLPLNGNLENQGLADVIPTLMGTGITYVAGKIGQAIQCPNTCNSCIHMPGLKLQTGSWAAWIKVLGSGATSRQCLMSEGRDSYNDGVEFYTNQAGTTLYFKAHAVVLSTTIALNTWYHVVGTFGNNTIKLYVDGIQKATNTYTDDMTYTYSNDRFVLGKMAYSYTNTSNYFSYNGCLNDVRIYDHALSTKEVKELSKGLVLHYKLSNEGLGENLAHNTYNLSPSVTQQVEYKAYNVGVLDVTNGETVTVSFDLDMTVATGGSGYLLVYNTNEKGPHQISGKNSLEGRTLVVGEDLHERLSVTTTISNRSSSEIKKDNDFVEFYSNYSTENEIHISNIKVERGTIATPWLPNPSDTEYAFLDYNDTAEYDHSGFGNDGTKTNITTDLDTPRYSTSYFFDGNTSVITVPYDATAWQTNFTLNLWFKKHELGSKNYETLFGGPSGFEMDTRANNATTLSLYMASTRGGNVYSPFNFDEWYMVTLVNDGTNELYYINGELVKTIEKKAMPTGNYFLGAWQTATKQNFKGWMSDFRIYATPLSEKDIKELYTVGTAFDKQGRVMTYEVVEV